MDGNNELVAELLQESLEHLSDIEPDILELEKSGKNVSDEILNHIFRAIHSIKGGFSFFGFTNIRDLSHELENLLGRLRDKQQEITVEIIDVLFEGMDKLKHLLDELEKSNELEIEDVIVKLKALEPGADNIEPARQNSPNPKKNSQNAELSEKFDFKYILSVYKELSEQKLNSHIQQGHYIYEINWEEGIQANNPEEDPILNEWRKLGDIAGIHLIPQEKKPKKSAKGRGEAKQPALILFTSVLEEEYAQLALNIDPAQIRKFDDTALKTDLKKTREKAIETIKTSGNEKKAKAANSNNETLRVKLDLLNNLMNLAGELVLSRNQIMQQFNQPLKTLDGQNQGLGLVEKLMEDFQNQIMQSVTQAFPSAEPEKIQNLQGNISNHCSQIKSVYSQASSKKLSDFTSINSLIQQFSRITSDLQEGIMQSRMQPIGLLFNKFPRVIRDLSKMLGKEISLHITGSEVEMDKSVLELLTDPLTHLIRNCCDHGIEPPEEREQKGKNKQGFIQLSAYHKSGKIVIEIKDDGAGLNIPKIVAKALDKKIISEDEAMILSENEKKNLIFRPGFSTAKNISNVSGRGVGLDVVKTNVEKLGGILEVDSEFDKGMLITLRLPLTLAIIPSLILSVEGRKIALPQVGLEELVRIKNSEISQKIENVNGFEVLRLRGKLLPLVKLTDVLNIQTTYLDSETNKRHPNHRIHMADRRNGQEIAEEIQERRKNPDRRQNATGSVIICVINIGKNHYGLIADSVINNEEIVVKPLSAFLKDSPCYSGVTILGDGQIAMILDSVGISEMAKLKFDDIAESSIEEAKMEKERQLEEAQAMLSFKVGGSELLAFNLSMISRIEKIHRENVENISGKLYLKYESKSLPLIELNDYLPISRGDSDFPYEFVIIPKLNENQVGILASELFDTVNCMGNLEQSGTSPEGILGSQIVNKNMLLILDLFKIVEKAQPKHKFNYDFLNQKKILIAEDTDYFGKLLRAYLDHPNCELKICSNGKEAWDALSGQENFDLILSDLNMPGMDGYELASKIKSSDSLKSIPVVAMSSTGVIPAQERDRKLDFDAVESKWDKKKILLTLSQFLN